jgi:hypothetical protein
MQYKVHQITLTEAEIDLINEKGHDAVHKQSLKLDMGLRKNDTAAVSADAMRRGYYTHVANIEADSLEEVFHIGNVGPESAYTRFKPMHSVSVGDVIETQDAFHVVASFGFEQLTPAN